MTKTENTIFIKQVAKQAGFDYCGIAKAVRLDDDAFRLEKWLNSGLHGSMHYMENYFDLRIDPSKLVPGAKSVITLLKNYHSNRKQNAESPKISKYAYGKDYHEVIKKQLKDFYVEIAEKIGEIHGRGFVDSAPVLERTWARRSGLGWIGKNGNLITKESGSFYFIATFITSLELEYDDVYAKNYCGTCTQCIDKCPTNAILPGNVVDGSKCISYFTIELKEALIPGEMKNKFNNWVFGCDICQDVCPWNRFSKNTNELAFTPLPEVLNFTSKDWEALTEESFKKIFKHSAINRAKLKGMQRNIRFVNSDV